MSFEGYREYECQCGNIDASDVYALEPAACSSCGGRYKRIRLVDQTNVPDDVGPWREVEYRQHFGDYVSRGYDLQPLPR